uniref:uncharacterized protein LOC108949985 isoform X2 n=1 Tax=Ciona intestinalis TaxID=7719 RepID=UPI000EF47630|nr:uncharacterized protein LOC108949985 isoform X2 [Ciona intestinalis]|eukprot:XP_026692925.1 uncharacterized protein LOC108949985 isoform X2 [Ciona intestinalis]
MEAIFAPSGRKYYEAHFKSCRRLEVDPAFIGPRDLVDHYLCCMLVKEAEGAKRTKDQINVLLKEKAKTMPNEIQAFADTIRGEWRGMEAILFYQIAAEFYGNQSEAGLGGIANCVIQIRESIVAMLTLDEDMIPIVRSNVITLMHDMQEMIRRSNNVSEEDRCLKEAECLHEIGYCEYLVDDMNACEKTFMAAIVEMERVFKERAVKYKIYSSCLNNLGYTYELTSRFKDACKYFRTAIETFRKAEDVNDDERDKWTVFFNSNLERAITKMK